MILKCDAVFEGGGVKGIGFVGAIQSIEKAGYKFRNVAGTSAGAIVASMVAAGFNGLEIKKAMKSLDYESIKGKNIFNYLGLFGKSLDVLINYGIYNADYFEEWLNDILLEKKVHTFKDIKTEYRDKKYIYGFQAIASDITDQKMLVLPNDLEQFGINPDDFSIAKAVRMSMSIPIYFQPYKLKDKNGKEHIIVDGGLLSNYPIWLLDDGTSTPPWPTFGFLFKTPQKEFREKQNTSNIIEYGKAIINTMLDAHDAFYISESSGDYERTINIPIDIEINGKQKFIGTTDFAISKKEEELLFNNGKKAGEQFLKNWNFEEWIKKYRK